MTELIAKLQYIKVLLHSFLSLPCPFISPGSQNPRHLHYFKYSTLWQLGNISVSFLYVRNNLKADLFPTHVK